MILPGALIPKILSRPVPRRAATKSTLLYLKPFLVRARLVFFFYICIYTNVTKHSVKSLPASTFYLTKFYPNVVHKINFQKSSMWPRASFLLSLLFVTYTAVPDLVESPSPSLHLHLIFIYNTRTLRWVAKLNKWKITQN